jgi:hypothetical protein
MRLPKKRQVLFIVGSMTGRRSVNTASTAAIRDF